MGGGFDSGVIIKTTNGGTHWFKQNFNENAWLTSVYFINSLTGYIAGFYFDTSHTPNVSLILKTTNGGINWITQLRGVYYMLYTIFFNNVMTGYAGGIEYILKTTNGGLNWYSQTNQDFYNIQSIFFTNINTGFAVNSIGIIFRTTNGGEPIGIRQISSNIPESFSLYQNYPNPFNPSTKIKFEIPVFPLSKGVRGMSVRLTIYDLLGRKIATLVNEQLKPGKYEVEWDGSKYASGVYFYRIEAGDFIQTRKLVLLK